MSDIDNKEEHKCSTCSSRWYFITLIIAIIVFGLYEMESLFFDRMEKMQQTSRQVIER